MPGIFVTAAQIELLKSYRDGGSRSNRSWCLSRHLLKRNLIAYEDGHGPFITDTGHTVLKLFDDMNKEQAA